MDTKMQTGRYRNFSLLTSLLSLRKKMARIPHTVVTQSARSKLANMFKMSMMPTMIYTQGIQRTCLYPS